MKVSKAWLSELVDLKISIDELLHLLPLRTIGLKETTPEFFELDMKGYNRADLLSMRGVAYEVSAITDSEAKFNEPCEEDYFWSGKNLPQTPVTIEEEKLCSLQCVAKIEGLTFAKSSTEWINKLSDSGMRSVNNIADVTNLVMLEYGQPLHSFDAKTVRDDTINVRLANANEEITTLDHKLRKLTTEDIVLADTEKALDVAGVMGGKDTEITIETTTILLSASLFNPQMVGKTSHKLGLRSEASTRFQHGLTKKRLLQAFDAAIRMYESLGGKVTAITLTGDLKDKERKITLSRTRLETIIGMQIKPEEVEDYLQRLNFQVHKTGENWELIAPYFRLDIEIEDDVIEEVARMYGYEKIPSKELAGEAPKPIDQSFFDSIYETKVTLAKLGMAEIQTYSFYSTQVLNAFNFERDKLIKLLNPMSSETEYLRNSLWPNLLEVTARNLRNGVEDIAMFEIGKVYSPQEGDLPKEEHHLAIALCNKTNDPIRELCQIAKKLGLQIQISREENKCFHPTRFAFLEKDGEKIGKIAEIHPRIVNGFGIQQRTAILEIRLTEKR